MSDLKVTSISPMRESTAICKGIRLIVSIRLREIVLLLFPESRPVLRKLPQLSRSAADTKPVTLEWLNTYAILEHYSGPPSPVNEQKVDATCQEDEELFNAKEASGESIATAEDETRPLEDDTLAIDMEFVHYVLVGPPAWLAFCALTVVSI